MEEIGVKTLKLKKLTKYCPVPGYSDEIVNVYYAEVEKIKKSNLYNKKKISISDLFKSHYNLVLHYQRVSDKINLEKSIDTCETLAKKFNPKPIYEIFLKEKKASFEDWNNQPNTALKLLKDATNQLENIHPDSGLVEIDQKFLLILYGRIASIYKNLGNLEQAKYYFEKFSKIDGVIGETTFYRSFLYSRYAEVLKEEGSYAKAYEFEQKSNTIGNAYLNPRNEKNKGFLTIKNRYKEELIRKKEQLTLKNLELAKKTEDILRFRIVLFIIIFFIVIIALIFRQRIKNLRFKQKQKDSKELLDLKNKELTTNTLQLIEKEQLIKKLRNYIEETSSDSKSKVLLKSIERNSVSLWDSFNRRFNQLNKGFYERLQIKVPDLSRGDRKLCALIKLNFTGKEMAYLLGISLGSVHVARHRLRKKMNLDRNQNLTKFINSI